MTRQRRWLLVGVVVAVLLAGGLATRGLWAKRSAGPATANAASAPGATLAAQAIELNAGDVFTAQQADLVKTLAISGSLKAVDSAFVKARVAAEIKELTVREGDRVSAGQLIGRLDATEYQLRLRQAEDQANSAQSQLEIAERTLANNKALVDQGFISQNALDTSVSNAAGARASLQAARAAADLSRKAVRDSEIRAPIAGLVSQRLVQAGERVSLDTRLLEIVDLSRIELEAAVAPEDVLAVRVGQVARVQIDGMDSAAPGANAGLTAKVVRINPSAQAGTRSVATYLQLEPHPALRQGLFARASIQLQRQPALVVPASAIRSDQALPYVLAVESGKAVARTVTLGGRGDVLLKTGREAAVEITNGLAAGTVVLRGTVGNLRAGTLLRLPG